MGGFFGIASDSSCTLELFFGVDYHSHLGTRRGGMAVYNEENGFNRVIHNIENSPFRTKFENDLDELEGNIGIGCISDNEPQPLLIRSRLGSFSITTTSRILNKEELVQLCYKNGHTHFLEMSGSKVNSTELIAALINQKDSIPEGLRYAQEVIQGSMSALVLTEDSIYAARDYVGRTPLVIGKKEGAMCASFEDFAYVNLGFTTEHNMGPGEICKITSKGYEVIYKPLEEMKICSFLWVYYGYPTASYEGVNVEQMRYNCGNKLAMRDEADGIDINIVAGVPDSGFPHAIGYSNYSSVPFGRPFIKYTPTWPRSFMPRKQSQRNLIAKMKLIPVDNLIKDKSILLIDDSIVRGTQLSETTEFLYNSGCKAVHVRPGCPPIIFSCKYLGFSRNQSDLDLITRRIIREREGDDVPMEVLRDYADPDSQNYKELVEEIRKRLNFTSLRYNRLDDMLDAIGLDPNKICTYCFSGKE